MLEHKEEHYHLRTKLVKTILEHTAVTGDFENLESIKNEFEKNLNANLKFPFTIDNISIEEAILAGEIVYKTGDKDDDEVKSVRFSVISKGVEYTDLTNEQNES